MKLRSLLARLASPGKRLLLGTGLLAVAILTATLLLALYCPLPGLLIAGSGTGGLLAAYCVAMLIVRGRTYYKTVLKGKLEGHRYLGKILTDYGIKTLFLALIALAINVGVAVINGVSAVRYLSVWYGALAGYYVLLIVLRGAVIATDRRLARKYPAGSPEAERGKLKISLGCGAMLLVLEIAIVAALFQMVLSERPTQSGQIYAISTAAYTFYKVTMAIVNFVRAQRIGDPVTRSLRNINIADAGISLASLTVLMIGTFGEQDGSMLIMKACVGMGIAVMVAVMAVGMILRSAKKIREGNYHETREV